MTNVAFITGITGQDGSYLAEFLLEKGYTVYGIVRRTSLLYTSTRLDHIRDRLHLRYGDLTDALGIQSYIRQMFDTNPDCECLEIYNLGAQSHVAISFEIPSYTADTDAIGVLNLLEIIKSLPKEDRERVKFYQAGTSELYGDVLETPQSETTPFNPVSPYAVAKQYAYYITKVYRESYGMYAVNGILFNHESPRRGHNFVTMKVVNAVKKIASGEQEVLTLGNIYSKRDWGHAKDYVKGMWLMMQQEGIPKDYVLAMGNTYSVKEFVERAFAYKGINITWSGNGLDEFGTDQEGNVRVKIDPKYYRPHDVTLLLGDSTKARTELGWKFEYDTLDSLVEDMFEGH